MDRLTAMQVFVEVAHSGSFSATADKLDMSRAMVTRYVGELEQWLGARLLQRTTRSVTLTDAGENCLRRSQQMLALMENVEEETAQPRRRAARAVAHHLQHVAGLCADGRRRGRLLEAAPAAQDRPQRQRRCAESGGGAHRPGHPHQRGARPDADWPRAGAVHFGAGGLTRLPGARRARRKLPADLAAHRCLSYANFGKSVWKLQRGDEQAEVRVGSHFSANEATALLQAALAGGGVALQPTYLANPHLRDGRLQVVLPDWKLPDMAIYALYPSRKHLSPAVRALLDFLVERFAKVPWN